MKRDVSARPSDASLRLLLLAAALALASSDVRGDGTVTGYARFERIKGNPSRGHVQLYESNLFLCPDGGTSIGPSYRLGAPPGEAPRGDGFYSLRVPAGTWSIVVNQPLFFIAPKVVPGITVRDGGTTRVNVELPIDYSTYFTDDWTVWDDVWMQTFVGTGTSITAISWKLAGTQATEIRASVHGDNGNPNPLSWPQVSARAAKADSVGALTDNWVRWRSGEVPTVPGRTYAVKLSGTAGGDRKFAVFHRPKDAASYPGGRAYNKSGAGQNFDLNITVFSANDGTAVLYNKTTEGLGELRDDFYGNRWGQTFRATSGSSLAAVDAWAAGGDRNWDLDFTFRVREGGPAGRQVGPLKTTKAAYQAFGAGLHAVSYNPGEVPLEPGGTYYVEFTNPIGFNPYVMDDGADAYPLGTAFRDGAARSADLSLTIVVYTEEGGTISGRASDSRTGRGIGGVTITAVELGRSAQTADDGTYELRDVPAGTYTLRASRTGFSTATRGGVTVEVGEATSVDFELDAEPCEVQFRNPGFESGLSGWTTYGDARNETEEGSWFGGISAREGARFHGNAINGCCLNGGLYQQFCSLPGHRYRVSAWSNIYWIRGGSSDATSRLGLDPNAGTDASSSSIVWSALDRQTREATEAWRRMAVVAEASGPVMTIFLDFRQSSAGGDQWRINCFDLVEVEDLDAEPDFLRGDCDSSTDANVTDAIFLLEYLFRGGPAPQCDDACDANDDGGEDLSDAGYLLNFLFLGGPAPPLPGIGCGQDLSGDALDCEASSC